MSTNSLSRFSCILLASLTLAPSQVHSRPLQPKVDPVTRYVHIAYTVPREAPSEMIVRCELKLATRSDWKPARVWPYVSETTLQLMQPRDWETAVWRGTFTERRAGGLTRTAVWNPFPDVTGQASVRFRVTLLDGEKVLAREEAEIALDNSDVVVLDDWSQVLQKQSVSEHPAPGSPVWWIRKGQQGEQVPAQGSSLEVREKGVELPQLTYPLNLTGPYAIFVSLPPRPGSIELRLSGDERPQIFDEYPICSDCGNNATRAGGETFWRWTDMTRQHLVIKQPHSSVREYEDTYRAHLDTVRLVPLTQELVRQLEERWSLKGEKLPVVGYNEPYSWAFYEKILSNLQHWEPLLAFAEARVDIVDIQIGRGGSQMNHETRAGSQLLAGTYGDPRGGKVPITDSVGLMQQFTNTLGTQLKYARLLGMKPHANLGATNCYPGTPLEAEFSKKHPEWRIGGQLKYEVPEVRQFILALFEEALQIGAEGISLDWCRYPYSVRSKETVTNFFRELRSLADRYGKPRGLHIPILTRFPARGVRGWEFMDYATWVKEGLTDFLCPSNIQARHLNFDVAEYAQAVKGTRVKLLPSVDALGWGLQMPGMWFERILRCYKAGADGIHIYQADYAVLNSPQSRRYVSIAGSPEALKQWRQRERLEQSRYSKGIYINPPQVDGQYQRYARLRAWIEGFQPEKVEMWVDGQLMNRYDAPPYVLTSEDRSDDETIKPGKHLLRIRAKEGSEWLEQEFQVEFGK
ncbi:MAG: hypothetical protein FJW26_07810 [Acidimicrobiia bacterium]|nr:hypothetical protein [Acidimicrobiia bacterium]